MQIEIDAAELRIGDKIIWNGGNLETTVTSVQKYADPPKSVHVYEAESQGGPPAVFDPRTRVQVRRGEEGQPRE